MTGKDKKKIKNVHYYRGMRFATGLNVCISVFLAMTVFIMINYISSRYNTRWDISSHGYYALSDKTIGLLSGISGDVNIVVFFRKSHELYDDIKKLLKEYEYATAKIKSLNLKIDFIDPDRDLAHVREQAHKYNVSGINVIVFEAGGRKKYIKAEDIVDYQLDYSHVLSARKIIKNKVGFKGEQVFSSAIQNVIQNVKPVVYFLRGHGERDISNFNEQFGYSKLAQIMRGDNIELKTLNLSTYKGVPENSSAVVIAGPDKKLSRIEVDFIREYLDKNGRILLLIDPAVVTGLEKLMKDWGVKTARDVAVDPYQTLTGRDLFLTQYGEHPITANLKNTATMFYFPRSIESITANNTNEIYADKPRVISLASTSKKGWAEYNLNQSPSKFNPEIDRPGPISVAVAVEKGAVNGIDVEIQPTRMVIIGDSDFVSNGGINNGVGGNSDFFMNALNWLLERESIMAIAPKTPGEIHLDMNRRQIRMGFIIVVVAIPAIVAFFGLIVWWRRRQ